MAVFSLNLQPASATSQVNSKTLVLYEAASGSIPTSPLLSFTDFPFGVAAPIYENQLTILDTTAAGNETYAGWVSTAESITGFPWLDRAAGFQVNFSVGVERESHANNQRSGFNVILLGNDAKGLELAFWTNEIWVQNDNLTGGLFTHGEGVNIDTTNFTDYQITMSADTYTLSANGTPILSGPVRDYSSFEGFPDPYQTPNFLFMGDNTTSAQARTHLGYVSITGTDPMPVTTTPTVTPVPVTASPVPLTPTTIPPAATPTPTGGGWQSCPPLALAFAFSAIWIKSNRVKRDRF
ncbi:MAG TPA: hypothetical protein VFQ23_07455 [Anaerolineales bacterium]|nr:hypothetical protein [Anaerolineales bacterium]